MLLISSVRSFGGTKVCLISSSTSFSSLSESEAYSQRNAACGRVGGARYLRVHSVVGAYCYHIVEGQVEAYLLHPDFFEPGLRQFAGEDYGLDSQVGNVLEIDGVHYVPVHRVRLREIVSGAVAVVYARVEGAAAVALRPAGRTVPAHVEVVRVEVAVLALHALRRDAVVPCAEVGGGGVYHFIYLVSERIDAADAEPEQFLSDALL